MGYKVRDDAPRSLSLPAPVGGGDLSPTTSENIYEPGQPIPVITSDVVERFEAGDEHLVLYIEEVVEVDTREVEPSVAPGDVQSPEHAEAHIAAVSGIPFEAPAAPENTPDVPAEPDPVAEPIAEDVVPAIDGDGELPLNEEQVAAAEATSTSEDNPFAAQ